MKGKHVEKRPIDPRRIRRIPKAGFSWIDRRFVRQGFIEELPCETILLYLFLATVSDAKGLSFYADPTISRLVKLSAEELSQARSRLLEAELVLYRYPLYQVLPLPEERAVVRSSPTPSPAPTLARGGEPMSLREVFALLGRQGRSEECQRSREP
jgi:hypothetical protein